VGSDGSGAVSGIAAPPAAGSAFQRRPEDPVTVFGIAADNVVRIDVVAGGKTSRATLTGNGYYWVADTPVSLGDVHLLVRLKNGNVVRS
jgi:hypothetical protein